MADQCIVCLESLDLQPLAVLDHSSVSAGVAVAASDATTANGSTVADAVLPATATPAKEIAAGSATAATTINAADEDNHIAEIQICGHVLHDACLREWTGKANSCPICRQTFHLVNVWDRVGGTKLSSYTVEDKRQIADFDPQAWLDENPEDIEPARPCPICRSSDNEEVLLLCDSCNTPYHTHCIDLDCIPRGHWFCLECSHDAAAFLEAEVADPDAGVTRLAGSSDRRSDYLPRTQATMRRARQRARSDEWQGAWGQIAGHVFDALDIDLDNHDDDEALQNYRQSQRRRERERQAYQRWQQRLNIASRLGAHDVFANNLPRALAQQARQTPPPPQETPEEKEAWGALEKAMEVEVPNGTTPPNRRKRKSSSVTASPREPAPEPQRRHKRPRTRRAPPPSETAEASSSHQHQNGASSSAAPMPFHETSHQTPHDAPPDVVAPDITAPSFLSSLLREVEMTQPSDDENVRAVLGTTKAPVEHSSPATSPSPSGYSSPRALSATPPPRNMNERPGSPLTLTSRIEPIYPWANFPPTRYGSDSSDSESRSRPQTRPSRQNSNGHSPEVRSPELRRPRPRRQHPGNADARHGVGSPDSSTTRASPTRATLSLGTKEAISAIIKTALKPHYRSGHINTDQYTAINRDLSRKLYTEVSDVGLDEDTKRRCEKLASKEVARAVADLRV